MIIFDRCTARSLGAWSQEAWGQGLGQWTQGGLAHPRHLATHLLLPELWGAGPLPVISSLHGQLVPIQGQEQGLQPLRGLQQQVLVGSHTDFPPESCNLDRGDSQACLGQRAEVPVFGFRGADPTRTPRVGNWPVLKSQQTATRLSSKAAGGHSSEGSLLAWTALPTG